MAYSVDPILTISTRRLRFRPSPSSLPATGAISPRPTACNRSGWTPRAKRNDFTETVQLAAILLRDEEDLIHKAVGWMLREMGKRDIAAETRFLKMHYHNMPRTMLRYAIEKFPEARRKAYLHGQI